MLDTDGAVTMDHQRWAELVHHCFNGLWKCNNPTRRSVLNDCMSAHTGQGIQLTPTDVTTALLRCKRRHVLDHYGCSASILQILADVRPSAVASVLGALTCSCEEMQNFTVQGTVRAKKTGPVPPQKVRTILPMPVLLGVVDGVVAQRIGAFIDDHARKVSASFLECARKHRQVLDAILPMSLIVEKGLDSVSCACVAQQEHVGLQTSSSVMVLQQHS